MAKRGPTKGGRVLVKLPFGDTTKPAKGKKGRNQLVLLKENVAKFLDFKPVKELEQETVTFKTAAGSRTVKRTKRQGSFRNQSVTLILKKPTTIGKSPGTYKTISLPLGSGCTVNDAIRYFQKNGASKGIIGLRTQDGQRYQWDFSD